MNISCSAQTEKQTEITEVKNGDVVEVIYFHANRRCATCKAIEEVSKTRLVKRSTIILALMNKEKFKKNSSGKYRLV